MDAEHLLAFRLAPPHDPPQDRRAGTGESHPRHDHQPPRLLVVAEDAAEQPDGKRQHDDGESEPGEHLECRRDLHLAVGERAAPRKLAVVAIPQRRSFARSRRPAVHAVDEEDERRAVRHRRHRRTRGPSTGEKRARDGDVLTGAALDGPVDLRERSRADPVEDVVALAERAILEDPGDPIQAHPGPLGSAGVGHGAHRQGRFFIAS